MKKLFSMFMTLLMAGSLIAAEVLNTNFTQGQGSWTIDNVSMEGVTFVWQQTSQYGMKASAYYQNANHVSESWLISPAMDLSDADTVSLYIEHAMNKGTAQTLAVKAKAANDADWTTLNVVWPQGINWTFITSTSDISSAFAHKQGVQIAFVYISDASNAPTWEIKNVVVSASAASSVTPDPDPEADPIAMESCAAAAEAAMSVSGNNVPYNNGAKYTVVGYVTSIPTAYNATANNMTFWMADEDGGGQVLEAYKVVPESADNLPEIGDKVQVTGQLTKYNQIAEFAAGCTCTIVEKGISAVNLGEKTIAEFLELANTKDTCVLTGVVKNIQDTQYGNFDLVDATGTVYIYGLLTAEGVAKKFAQLGVAVNDSLTLKAVYSVYNGQAQAPNAVFVSVKKAVYSVAGSEALMGTNWDEKEGNEMTRVNDTTYQLVLEDVGLVENQNYEYKVVINHMWNNGEAANNSVLSIAVSGRYDITILYNPVTTRTYAQTVIKHAEIVIPSLQLAGDFNSWQPADMTVAADSLSASLTVSLEEGTHEFKVLVASNWMGNGYAFTRQDTSYAGLTVNTYNMTLDVDQAGDYTFTWAYIGNVITITYPEWQITSCATAAIAATSVSGTNVLYNNGAEYTLVGYVTGIATDYNASRNFMTFWMADEADGGQVLQAFRVVPESADNLPEVGDKVQVTGQLTKYNQIPEFAAGCTCIIIEKSAPAVNLGEMTIAEFLELKNPKDTCILTGTVSNIVDTQNGYFDLVEPGNENISVYVYGLQTADGRAQQFNTLGIAAGDTLTLKGIYYDYNGKDEVKYGIFVELKKVYIEPETQTIEINTPSSINYRDAVATNGWWIMSGEDDTFSIMLSNLSTDITQAVGSYTAEELDPEYSFIIMSASPQDTILFTDGEIILSYDTVGTQAFVYINGTLVGTDGNSYLINLIYEKTLPISYYLVGSFNGWAPADAYELKANFNAEGEYKMNVTLAVGDELKVVSKQGDVLTWYPDNAGNYVVDAAHAGDKTLYFRPEGNSEWASFHTGGFFYIDETPIPEVVNITLTTGLIYQDNVESYGWWQMYGNFDDYTISLSNGNSISEAPGTYTADDLDVDYSYIQMTGSDTKITFTAGTVTLSVDETTYAVTVAGQLTGIDEKIYNLQLTYCEPKAENTVQLSIEGTMKDYVETLNGYSNYGTAEDGTYVQLLLLTDNPVGTFTADNLATNYSFLQINGIYINIYSADITVVKRADGSYLTIADLLCYNNTLYQVTITVPAPVATSLDATTSTRAKKYIHNGMLIIEKNGHRYNAFGQMTD